MKIERVGFQNGHKTFALTHSTYSPLLMSTARIIPGLKACPLGVIGGADAIRTAITWLSSKGLAIHCDTEILNEDASPESHLAFDLRLREYQVEGAHFLARRTSAILADDMGLGKTATAITAMRNTCSKWVVVAPSYVRGVWHNPITGGELKKWWPEARVFTPHGTKGREVLSGIDIVLIHYDILHAWADEILAWKPDGVVFDECHYLMSENSRRTKAAAKVSSECLGVWGLSGTPLTSRPRDLWGVLSVIAPGRFGDNFFAFGVRYCAGHKEEVAPAKTVWKFDGKSNEEELRERLSSFMLRRTKADVALELPPKTRQVIYLEPKGKRRVSITGLDSSRAALRSALDLAADFKINDAEALARDHLTAGSRVVLFTWRKSVAEHLAEKLGGACIHGGVSTPRRLKILTDETVTCIAATIDSSATGIDLSRFDVAIFVELTYEPHELLQAEARLHRFGAAKPVLIQYLIAKGTSDELVANAVVSKLETFEAIVGGKDFDGGMKQDLTGNESEIMASLYRDLGVAL